MGVTYNTNYGLTVTGDSNKGTPGSDVKLLLDGFSIGIGGSFAS